MKQDNNMNNMNDTNNNTSNDDNVEMEDDEVVEGGEKGYNGGGGQEATEPTAGESGDEDKNLSYPQGTVKNQAFMVAFMKFKNGVAYEKNHVFSKVDLMAICPLHVWKWLNQPQTGTFSYCLLSTLSSSGKLEKQERYFFLSSK